MEAMNGKYQEWYMEAMDVEMQALQKATTWKIVPRSEVPQGAKQHVAVNLGVQAQEVSGWKTQKIQGPIVHLRQ